jgi:group I intron endonuclease
MIGIYKITSPSNKVYIGLSKDIKKRWKGYSIKKKTAPQQPKLYYSFKKYGVENHKFEILEECKFKDLSKREIYYIKKYDSINQGLNVSEGGYHFGKVNIGKKHTKETIAKMKEYWAKNAKPRSKETISKISKTKKENPRETTPEMVEKFRNTSTLKKPILQYDLNGNFIAEYESINEAARHLNVRNDGISACLRKKQKSAYNFLWKYQK